MTSKDFVRAIAAHSGLTIRDTDRMYDAMVEVIADVLSKGDTVPFRGCMTLYPTKIKQKSIVSKFTGETKDYIIPEHYRIRAKISNKLKERLTV